MEGVIPQKVMAFGAVSAARTHEAMVAVLVDDVVAERAVEFGSEDQRP
jgi:hypothetical protein